MAVRNCSNCSSSSLGEEEEGEAFLGPPALAVELAKVLYGVVGAVGLCGNTLVIYVVLRFSGMRTVTNTYLLNLALADEMFLVGLPFLLATMTYASWPFGRLMCKLYMTSTSINQFTGSLLLTVVSADRYVAVCHPVRSARLRTAAVARCVCLAAWTLSALLMVPVYAYAGVMPIGPRVFSCAIHWPESAHVTGEVAFTLYAFTLGFALPLLLILLFYFLVLCRLRRRRRQRRHRRVTYLVLAVVTVYVICWLPYWCAQVWLTFVPPGQDAALPVSLMLATGCLSYANSAVNPLLYAFLSEHFRKSFARACACAAASHSAGEARPPTTAEPKEEETRV